MKITQEQKNAIEYLEKYTKWETYGERNLEKDIMTVLNLLKDLYVDNDRYEKELHYTIKYSVSVQKIKDKIKELKEEFEYLGDENKRVNKMTIETLQELLEESEE